MVIIMIDIEKKLKTVISSCSEKVDPLCITDGTDLINDFGFNSIDFIQLIVLLEDEFKMEIEDENLILEKLSSYNSLKKMIIEKLR